MKKTQDELQKECDKDNEEIMARREALTGYGPRRNYHWEMRGGQKCLVEE